MMAFSVKSRYRSASISPTLVLLRTFILGLFLFTVFNVTQIASMRSTLTGDSRKSSQNQSIYRSRLALSILDFYENPATEDPVTALNQALSQNGFESMVMKILPGNTLQQGPLTSTRISVRLAPFPADNIPLLLNILEQDKPRFYIDSILISRIGPKSMRMDVSLELIFFNTTRVAVAHNATNVAKMKHFTTHFQFR